VKEAFSGEGARLYGGRWNSPGARLVYTAEHASLAVLEMLVHLDSGLPLAEYSLIEVEFGRSLIEIKQLDDLPSNWRANPAPAQTQSIGDQWVHEGRSVVLQVPSAVLPIEKVFLLNPEHPDIQNVQIGKPQTFFVDRRLQKG
jgi:RES domain-containing protein